MTAPTEPTNVLEAIATLAGFPSVNHLNDADLDTLIADLRKEIDNGGPLSPRELAILRWTDAKDEARHRRMMRLLNGGVSR